MDFGFWILVWMRPYSTSFGSCIRYFHVTPTRVGGYIYIYIGITEVSWCFFQPKISAFKVFFNLKNPNSFGVVEKDFDYTVNIPGT